MAEPAIQSINQHTQKTSLDWLFNILVQPSTGAGSGVAPATHEQFGMSLDLIRQALVEITNVVNNVTTTVPGKVLDARQGKVLADTIQAEIAKYGQPNGIATLGSDGKVPASQIPSLALVDVFPVESEAAMLALDAEQGDMAIRTDSNQVFILSASPASTLENWIELAALKALVDAAIGDLAGDGRTTETVKANADDIISIKGTGYTEGSLKTHEDRLDTLEGTGEGSVAKAIDDAIEPIENGITDHEERIAQNESDIGTLKGDVATLEGVVDTNRLYSDSQYLELKAKADALQVKCNTLQAEVYTDAPILQYGATEIIGKGYESDDTPIDVSANVVDGSLELEQKGLTITNLVKNGDFSQGTTGWENLQFISNIQIVDENLNYDTAPDISILKNVPLKISGSNGDKFYLSFKIKGSAIESAKIDAYLRTDSGAVTELLSEIQVGGTFSIFSVIVTANQNFTGASLHIRKKDTVNPINLTIDHEYGVSAYNLTALGLDHITDTDILSKLLPYVDGTKNVGKIGLRVVGVNLANKLINGAALSSDGTMVVGNMFSMIFARVHEGMIVSGFGNAGGGNVFGFYTDDNITVDSITYNGARQEELTTNITVPSNQGIKWIGVRIAYNPTTFQINLGSTALPYEPYQEQLTFLPAIGNSLPNGTADSIKTVADGWEHSKRVSTPASVGSGVAVNTTNYPTAKNGGQWVNELTAGGTEIGVVGTDSTTGAGMLRFELATPIITHYDLPIPTSGKTIHRFAGEEKIALYGTGLTFSENVLSVLSAVKFVAGEMTDITSLATITGATVTFSGVTSTDVVYVKVEHDVDRPLGILEHTPAVSNTASRLASLEARVSALEA